MKGTTKIKIKYHTDGIEIKKIENGDWIDLCAAEDVPMKQGDFSLISLNHGRNILHALDMGGSHPASFLVDILLFCGIFLGENEVRKWSVHTNSEFIRITSNRI